MKKASTHTLPKKIYSIGLLSLFWVMLGAVGDVQGMALPSYEVSDLGFLACDAGPLCDESAANAINETGSIAGEVEVPAPHCFHAGLYRDGAWRDLGVLGTSPKDPTPSSSAHDVNNRNEVVGISTTAIVPSPYSSFVVRAFIWDEDRGMRDLGALGAYTNCFDIDGQPFCTTSDFSEAKAINDEGVVVGVSSTDGPFPHAFIWDEEGGMRDLGALPGEFPFSEAVDINNRGEVVGNSNGRAFIYKNGVMSDLDKNLPFSTAQAINNAGEVVLGIGANSYLWRGDNRPIKLLRPLPGNQIAQAYNLNDQGQVIGISVSCDTESCTMHPVLWDGDDVIDLGGIPGAGFNETRGINNLGQVVGTSQQPDEPFIRRGFLAEPSRARF